MTLKSDAKFEGKLTLGSKNDTQNLVNFNVSSGKSGNLHFNGLLLSIAQSLKSFKFSSFNLKSSEELNLMTLKNDPIFEEKLTFYLKNDTGNLLNFNMSSGKFENFHFDGLLL